MLLGLGGRLARDVSPVCFLNRFKEKKTSSASTAILEVSSHMQSLKSVRVYLLNFIYFLSGLKKYKKYYSLKISNMRCFAC